MRGNQSRLPLSSKLPPRDTHALRVVHFDVRGSFELPSLDGNKYFVSFMHEFTRMMLVTLIKYKHKMFNGFKKFKVKDEK